MTKYGDVVACTTDVKSSGRRRDDASLQKSLNTRGFDEVSWSEEMGENGLDVPGWGAQVTNQRAGHVARV